MTEKDIRRIFAKPSREPRTVRRSKLTARQRSVVLAKTAGTCHVCGGPSGSGWQADHVIPHERGGIHALDNFLPICRECNRLRWSYGPEVLRTAAPASYRPSASCSDMITPMVARLFRDPFDRAGWFFELKWDGFRAIAEVDGAHGRSPR